MQPHSFGYWLKRRRRALDLTQAELASQVGCSAAAIRKIEAEERRPSAEIVERLAEIFEIPQDERAAFLRFARRGWRSVPVETKGDTLWQVSNRIPPSNLPAPISSLIGRERETAEIQDYLLKPDVRLMTLMGPPGVGKTRLSIEAGHAVLSDFQDGVFFVALAPLEDPSLLASTIVQTLEYVERKGLSPSAQLVNGLGDKQMLIVLDNCEHLAEYVARLAPELLSACSRLKILATSRESLRIPGEWMYAIPPLKFPKKSSLVNVETTSEFPALTLFAERARAVNSTFALQATNVETVASICDRLDGLPLAIELMAARMRLMTPQALLEQLNNEFALTADGMRSISARQKTLNDAIAWSYDLLPEEEQTLFSYLSIFSGGFSLETAETVFSKMLPGISVSGLITSLFDKSLLQSSVAERGEIRFNMLVTIRQFALNRLKKMGNETKARNWHLLYFLNLAERAEKELRGPNQLEWLYRLGSERDNFRSALEWLIETQQTESALRLARKLDWFWFVRSDHSEGRQWLQRALALADAPLYPDSYAEALTQLAHHTWLQIGWSEARPFADQALSIARAHADKHNIARALSILGLILGDEGSFAAAQSALEESKTLYKEVRDEWGYAHAALCLGQVFHNQGDQATGLSLRQQVLPLFRKLGDRYFECATLSYIGTVQVMLGNSTDGVVALQESLILAEQLDSKYEVAMILRYFARAALANEKPARAVHLFWMAKDIFDSIGAWQEIDELKFEKELVPCRAALGELAFAEAAEQGRAMTMEQAIAYALEETK